MMKIKLVVIASIALSSVLFITGSHADWWSFLKRDKNNIDQIDAPVITWDDLIPSDFVQPENPFVSMSQKDIEILLDGSDESNARLEKLQEEFNYAPVVEKLDGQRVKLAAYVTPLDFDGQTRMSEFLLVPYVGACLHTPPPPANQVVHAQSPTAIELTNTYDPIWAVGTLHTETVKSDLAESGYRFEIEKVLPYSMDK